jgi:hypothetical protein
VKVVRRSPERSPKGQHGDVASQDRADCGSESTPDKPRLLLLLVHLERDYTVTDFSNCSNQAITRFDLATGVLSSHWPCGPSKGMKLPIQQVNSNRLSRRATPERRWSPCNLFEPSARGFPQY